MAPFLCLAPFPMRGPLRRNSPNTDRKRPVAAESAIPTGGQIFADGTIIKLVEDPGQANGLALLKWHHRRKAVVSARIVHGGRAYVPLTLDPSVRRALRLPSHCQAFNSTATLFEQLVAVISRFTDLAEHFCHLLAAFVFASWLTDCLPVPVKLSLWSPAATDGARILRLLHALCRQALLLAGTSAPDLRLLPDGLQPTLLIFRPAASRRTIETLATCGWRGFHMARAGHLGEFLGSVALSTDAPLNEPILGPMIEIPVVPAGDPCPT